MQKKLLKKNLWGGVSFPPPPLRGIGLILFFFSYNDVVFSLKNHIIFLVISLLRNNCLMLIKAPLKKIYSYCKSYVNYLYKPNRKYIF